MEMTGSDTAHPDSNKICYFLTLKKMQASRRLLPWYAFPLPRKRVLFWCMIKDTVSLLFPKVIQAQTTQAWPQIVYHSGSSCHVFLAKYCLKWALGNRTDPHLRQKSHSSDAQHCLNSFKVSSKLRIGTLHTQNPILWKRQGFLSNVKSFTTQTESNPQCPDKAFSQNTYTETRRHNF